MIKLIKINVLGSYHVTNCYIIWDEKTKEAAIVDPADDAQKIIEKLNKQSPEWETIVYDYYEENKGLQGNEESILQEFSKLIEAIVKEIR